MLSLSRSFGPSSSDNRGQFMRLHGRVVGKV